MTQYGRYELIERIGQGTLTEVFRAKRYGVEGFEKTLVVKRLHEHLCRDAEFVQQFIRKGQLALRLSHSNVVHVLDLGEVDQGDVKSYFLATELVSGATLADVLSLARERDQPFVLEMALYVAAEICRALDHAHRRRDSLVGPLGVTHDRLSATNVFLSDEGEVKVSDFGTAALGAGGAPATSADAAGDLGALGSLLYEMLRLSPPPEISPSQTFTGFGLPIDDLLGRLLLGDPKLGAADVHEQLLMYAYACRDWVGAEQVAQLVRQWRSQRPEEHREVYPAELPNTQSSHPPAVAVEPKTGEAVLGDFRPFVGRSAETKRAGLRLARVAQRQIQVLSIVGGPGVGKSRFMIELRRRLKRGGLNIAFHVVRCPVGGQLQPYGAVVTMLRSLFGVVGALRIDRESLVVLLRTLGLSGPKANAILCELGASSDVEGAAPPLSAAVEQVFSRLADDRMHVFAWDDAEQMDEASAQLLAAVAESLATKRIAFLLAARELPSSALSNIEGFEQLHLEGLDSVALRRLVQVRLGVAEIPKELGDLLAQRCQGNPMFVEEMLREGITSGAIRVAQQSVVELDLPRISSVPHTLQTLLANRVRRLNDLELETLRLVARLDEWADTPRIASSTQQATETTATLLIGLAERNLVVVEQDRARLPTRLIEEALMADATPDQVAQLELRAAEALLDGDPDDARLLEQAAQRMESAGEPVRAAEIYERAARARAENARPERTIPLLLRSLELLPLEIRSPGSVLQAIDLLADSPVGGEPAKLAEMVRRLSSYLLNHTDIERGDLIEALLDLVRIQRASLHFHEAQQLLLRTQELAKEAPDKLAKVLLQLADTQIALGDCDQAVETLERFSRMDSEPSDALRHEALVLAAHAQAQSGDRAAALGLLEKAQILGHGQGELRALRTAQVRALVHALRGEWQQSGAAAGEAATLARSLGRLQQEAAYRHYEGEAHTYTGDYPRAYAAFRSSLALARDLGSERWVNRNRMLLAFIDGQDQKSIAKQLVGECLVLAERRHETQDVAKGRLLLGLLLREEGDEAAAQRELQLARQIALAIGHRLLVSECDAVIEATV